jgi:hypothetical protein
MITMELDISPVLSMYSCIYTERWQLKLVIRMENNWVQGTIKKATIANYTFLEGMCNVKSLNIWTFGRDGYLKLTLVKSMSPVTFSNTRPSWLIVSILDFRSRRLKTEIAESLALQR